MSFASALFSFRSRTGFPHVRMQVSKITDQVFLGTNQCCRAHYDALLLQQGVAHDISLEGEHLDQPYGAESYLWLPTVDHRAPSLAALQMGISYIDSVLAHGGKVYVHCKNGHGRSPTLVAAWLMSHGRTYVQAISFLKRQRPEIHLETVQRRLLQKFF